MKLTGLSYGRALLALGRRQHPDGGPMLGDERERAARQLVAVCARVGVETTEESVDELAVKFARYYDELPSPRPTPDEFLKRVAALRGQS